MIKGQDVIVCFKLYVVPLHLKTKVSIKRNDIKRLSYVTMNFKESCGKYEFDEIFDKIRMNTDTVATVKDYRILLVLKKRFLLKEKIYFNKFGEYYYKGKYYRGKDIFDIIKPFLPECTQ